MEVYTEKKLSKEIEKNERLIEKGFNQKLEYRILNDNKKSKKSLRGSKNK